MSRVILTASSDAAKAYLPLITVKGYLRSSKPKDGNAAFIWRLVAFRISDNARHREYPLSAAAGVAPPKDYRPNERACIRTKLFIAEVLDPIVKEIVEAVPPNERHGVQRAISPSWALL